MPNRPEGRLYVAATTQPRPPSFPPLEDNQWVKYKGRWHELNRDWLYQLLYPESCIIQLSNTRLLTQVDNIARENKERMEIMGLTKEDLQEIREV